jgi:hypothetical protein
MSNYVWTFERGAERVTLVRAKYCEPPVLTVTVNGQGPKLYEFGYEYELMRFQTNMETFLLKTGWCFASFSPERRGGRDRRGFPRVDDERRRWWTDGVPAPKQKVVWG